MFLGDLAPDGHIKPLTGRGAVISLAFHSGHSLRFPQALHLLRTWGSSQSFRNRIDLGVTSTSS